MDCAEASCQCYTGQGAGCQACSRKDSAADDEVENSHDDSSQYIQEEHNAGSHTAGGSEEESATSELFNGDASAPCCANAEYCDDEFKSCHDCAANVINNNVMHVSNHVVSYTNSDDSKSHVCKSHQAELSVTSCLKDKPLSAKSPPEEPRGCLPDSAPEELSINSSSQTSLHVGEQMVFFDLNELGTLQQPLLDSVAMATMNSDENYGLPVYRSERMETADDLELNGGEEEDEDDEDIPDLEDSISTVRTVCDTKVRSLSYAWEDVDGDTTGTFSELEENHLYTVTVSGTVRIGMDGARLLTCDQQDPGSLRDIQRELAGCCVSNMDCDERRNCDMSGRQADSSQHKDCDELNDVPWVGSRSAQRSEAIYQGYSGHHPSFFLADTFEDFTESDNDENYENSTGEMNKDIDDESEDDELHFSDFPSEIIRKIFSYFTQTELGLTLALVCRSWRDHAYDPIHWKRLILGFENDLEVAAIKSCIRRAPLVTHINLCWQRSVPLTLLQFMKDQCPMLTELDLGFCDCVDLSFIRSLSETLKQLQSLNLEGCTQVNHDCISALGRMPRLCRLNLSHCTMLDDQAVMSLSRSLSSIQTLNIDGISAVTDEAIAALVGLHGPSLEQLDLDGAELTDASIHALLQCTQLQGLAISFAELLTDTALLCIQGMKTLQRLQVKKGADFTSQGLRGMFDAKLLSNLRELSLAEATQLVDEGIQAIINCCGQRLTSLSLCWCWNVTDTGLVLIIDNCRSLVTLDLLGLDKITGTCLNRLPTSIPRLRTLNLQQCNRIIDELIVEIVRQMPGLKATNYYGEEFCLIDKG